MKIKKLRQKLKQKKFLEDRYDKLTQEAEDMNHFEDFKCSSFFVGYERAEYNQIKHDNKMKRITRQIDFIKRLLNIE